MSYYVEKLPGEPIIVYTLPPDFHASNETLLAEADVIALLDAANEPTFVIMDIHASLEFGDLLASVNRGGAGKNPLFTHPNIWETITISDSRAIAAVAKGLDSDAFGHVKNPVFPTYDEALDYIRSKY